MLESVTCFGSYKGYDIIKQKSPFMACSIGTSRFCGHSFSPYVSNQQVRSLSYANKYKIRHSPFVSRNFSQGNSSLTSSVHCWRGFYFSNHRPGHSARWRIYATLDVASAVDVINDLGFDTLTFLAVTVLVVPAFKIIKASPILGFFFAGIVLNQFGLIRNLTDVKILSEWGILFLLFEMGLELSFSRLKALAKFAFGMGLTQVVLSTLAFTAFELPPNGAIGTQILTFLFNSRPDLVNIRSVDEAVVIGAALSLSSSAFVLEAKLDRVIEKQREEYATLEKRHKFEMEKMLKVENEFAALKRKHQLQLEEKVKVENELKACRVEIEGLKVELNVMEEKNRNEYEEIEQKHRSDRLEMLKVENEVKKLKEELKAVEEKHKYEYKALEQKHQSHLLEVENELKHCKAEFQGLKEEQSISDEKYEKLLEEVNKHRKEEDEVVNFDPQRQSKEVESDPNVVLENEISRLDKFRNAKHLGSKNMDKRSKNSGMPDGSRKQKCIVTPNHVINVEDDFCGSVPASTSPRGNSVRNSGTSKSSNADTILLSDSDDDCAPAELKNFVLKRKRASSPNASNNNNGGHNFERESFPTSENKQSRMLGRCDSLGSGYGIQNNPPSRDQEILRPSEEKVGEKHKSPVESPAKVNGESDSSSASMFSSDDSEDDDDIDLESMMLFTTNRS